ncbi:MAG TPA: ATP-binding protein, partial [Terracidiphilus sp.]
MNRRLTPIVYIAFGDPENVPGAELPALKREEANICAALSNVCELGSWEVVSGRNCTRADLVKTFDSDRVAVFHFGGHASPQSLLLPAEEKGSQIVNGMLLEDFLARQANLKLAFFNACSTERWARKLSESIPYVVATVCAVDDGKALDFASAFYAALAADNTIEEAFSRASGAVVLQHEELKPVAQQAETDAVLGRTEFRRMDTNDEDATGVPPFPWILCRNGRAAADDTKWSFSVAAHDPLIGLPLLSPADYVLPERPYVTIKGHTEADAPLFFGRNAEIRALYDWALKNDGPPVLLFHGQSGAGKSSLLNAGLLPRLKKKQSVTYRKRGVNLVEDLHAAIGGGSDADISAWLDSPAPNLVILDQVEEAITHNAGSPDEMQAFVARVKEVFARRQPGSKARLLLSFRKEYLAEIQGLFAKGEGEGIGSLVETFWLDRLDTEGIVDVVEGPTRTPALAEKYKIALEDGFAEFVASRLNDPNSPIATILQIVLNQLWDKAKDRGGDPVYTRELWGSLSALDNPLHGFYGDQLERLFAEGGEAYRNGLELDMLLEHTTELGTSQRRTLMELEKFYPQLEPAVLAQLIQRNKDLYLLVDPPAQEGDGAAATVLAHDTLAPVIRRDHALSVNEGARARRLVENRSREWVDGKRGEPLDALDLRVVRLGLKNMRALNGDEQRMLTFSRKRARRNFGIAAAVLAGIAAIGGGIALYERAQEEAQARTKDAIRLASEAKAEASNDYDLAVLLSIAAFKTDPTRFEVRDAITSVYEARPEAIAFLHPKKPMTYIDGGMVFSQDSKLLAAENGNQLELWDVQQKKRLWTVQTVPDATESFGSILFSKDNKWMVLADETQGTQVRDVTTGALRQGGLPNVSKHLEAVSIGKSILVAGGACNLQAWFVDGWSGG